MTLRHPLHRKRKKGDTAQLAAQLAPLEEQDAHAARKQGANGHNLSGQQHNGGLIQEHGALIIDTNNLHVLKGLGEGGDAEQQRFIGVEPIVLIILCVILIFIAFIAWQVSLAEHLPLKVGE